MRGKRMVFVRFARKVWITPADAGKTVVVT